MDGSLKLERWIAGLIEEALKNLSLNGEIPIEALQAAKPEVEKPKSSQFGDFSTNAAMKLSKAAGISPRDLAQKILYNIDLTGMPLRKIVIEGPGFLNFYLEDSCYQSELEVVIAKKEDYGSIQLASPRTAIVEFVSANPTGPIHIGNARGGAVGDAIGNIYKKAGWGVAKEFYINDAGNQIAKFGESLSARYMQLADPSYPFPDGGYLGEDIIELAQAFKNDEETPLNDLSPEKREETLSAYALERNIKKMHDDLDTYRVIYDCWFSESALYSGPNDDILAKLKTAGAIYEKDGAVWFKASSFGCEKDEVLVRANGLPTYYLSDIAYHYNKLAIRNFDIAVNVWGADHHGHVQRMKAALSALGIDPKRLVIIIIQLVRLMEGDDAVRLSKRKGQIVTLSDLLLEVGIDAARFIFNFNAASTHMDFDLGLAVRESNENPVFYVQYAYARMRSILRLVERPDCQLDTSLLIDDSELALLKKISDFSKEVYFAAVEYDPSRITRYAYELASVFHSFYNAVRVKTDDQKVMLARLALVEGASYVLKSSLQLIGVSAPEQM